MTGILRDTRDNPGIETYSTTALMQWCRAIVSDLRMVSVVKDEEKVYAAKFFVEGEDIVVTASSERDLAVQLVSQICQLRGWRVPGSTHARDQYEADIVSAAASGNADLVKALVRDLALRNEESRGYRGARPAKRAPQNEGWQVSTGPTPGARP
jgi:hypothetical protein